MAERWDAWARAAAPWQEGLQSLSAGLLPLAAAAVLVYALLRRLPPPAVLGHTLPPMAAGMGLSFALLLPLWSAPEVFLLTWPNLYLYWFLALGATLAVYGIYLVLSVIFKGIEKKIKMKNKIVSML